MELLHSNLNLHDSEISNTLKFLDMLNNEVFFLYDCKKGGFVYVSQSAERVLGHPSDKFCDEGIDIFTSIIHPDDYQLVFQWYACSIVKIRNMNLVTGSSNPQSITFRVKHENGNWIWIELSYTLIEGHNEDRRKVLGTIRDVSNWKNHFRKSISEKIDEPKPAATISIGPKTHEEVTRREKEVLYLIANGLSAKEIAEKLFISMHTAINHRKNLIAKFEVKNTAELIKVASKYYWL